MPKYVVYNDGLQWRQCDTEEEAKAIVATYDGDHSVYYEKENN